MTVMDSQRKLFTATLDAAAGERMLSENASNTRRWFVGELWIGIIGLTTFAVLSAPVASGVPWTQTTQADFIRGTWSNIEVLASGDLQLASNNTWSKAGVVLDVGSPPSPDSSQARAASVMKDGATYRMWYTGSDGSRLRGLYATSTDGLSWTRQGITIDVLTAPYNFDLIAGTSVMKEGSTYRMWFSGGYWGGGPFGELWARIYYATSTDGASWTIQGVALDLSASGSWDDHGLEFPSVTRDSGGVYFMYYLGWTAGPVVRTGVATSPDGTAFTRPITRPVVDVGPAWEWDRLHTAAASALPGAPWRIWYTGADETRNRIGLATSIDGVTATKSPSNPVLVEGAPGSLDDNGVAEPEILLDGTNLLLYYTMLDGISLRIGLAREVRVFAMSGWYESAVLDSGSDGTTWTTLSANATVNPFSVLALQTRSGHTASPDPSWSPWSGPMYGGSAPISSPRARYLHVRVEMNTSSSSYTPTLNDFSVTYELNTAAVPVPLSPVGGVWVNASSPLLRWAYGDPEGDPQAGFQVEVSDRADFLTLAVDSEWVSSIAASWRPPALADGGYFWRVRTTDAFGLWSGWTTAARVGIDSVGPTATALHGGVAVPSGILTLVLGDRVELNATDSGSGVARIEYSLDGGPWAIYSAPIPFDAAGRHVLAFRAVDNAGNSGDVTLLALDAIIPFNWTPVLALTFAIVLAILGAVIVRRRAGSGIATGIAWGQIAGPATVVEGIIGVYSLLTGELPMPPWAGAGLLSIVAVLGGGIASLAIGSEALLSRTPPPG